MPVVPKLHHCNNLFAALELGWDMLLAPETDKSWLGAEFLLFALMLSC